MESHQIITPHGKKVKETLVKVKNGKGTKTVLVEDDYGVHADTMPLNVSELRNIQKRKFMPGLFKSSMKNIKTKKSHKLSKRKTAKKATAKKASTKKASTKKGKFLGLF